MHGRLRACLNFSGFCAGQGAVEVARFLVLDVARGFADVGLVGEHVESRFADCGADEHWIASFGFLK